MGLHASVSAIKPIIHTDLRVARPTSFVATITGRTVYNRHGTTHHNTAFTAHQIRSEE